MGYGISQKPGLLLQFIIFNYDYMIVMHSQRTVGPYHLEGGHRGTLPSKERSLIPFVWECVNESVLPVCVTVIPTVPMMHAYLKCIRLLFEYLNGYHEC